MSLPLPKLPMGEVMTGSETVVMRQAGVPKRFSYGMIVEYLLTIFGKPKRIQAFTSTASTAAGAAKVVFSPAFTTPPVVLPGTAWTGSQIVHTIPKNVTAAGCDVTIVRSRSILVGTNSPFETAAGLIGAVTAIGE